MPFVRISFPASTPAETHASAVEGIHRALVGSIGIPDGDRFQLVEAHAAAQRFFHPDYMGIERRDVVLVEITFVRGRSDDKKRALFKRVTAELVALGIRSEDVMVILTENGPSDWSIGNGDAQLLDAQRRELEASPAS